MPSGRTDTSPSSGSSQDGDLIDHRSLQKSDGALARAFTSELIKRGVVKNTQKMYLSLVHGEADIAATLQAAEDALKALPKRRR